MPDQEHELTLEKLKISERLHEVEISLTKFVEKFEAHIEKDQLILDRVSKIVEKHDDTLYGRNGSDGMKVDIDRLKQKEIMRNWFYAAVGISIIGLVVRAVWEIITHQP